ncbi:hypothetical protein NL494_27210, partial [Klebsiella pneumoniae]|nr:hypothetical protein [Klebsiella pneumoniae]
MEHGKRWTPEEDAELRAIAHTLYPHELAKHFNRSEQSVKRKCWSMSLSYKLQGNAKRYEMPAPR